ncbi:MAG TPA: alpha/beta hydrolase [bacterium]|nr:alpha/beta hydrolase [bacterium]
MQTSARRLLAPLLVLASVLASCAGKTPPIQTPHGIASLEKATLGGVEQWILIRGDDVHNPVLLFVHGGPGSPEMPVAHEFGPELEQRFVVVHWDQRGAGKSFHAGIRADSMNVAQFISDAHELTELLRSRFHADKIYLVGHSWGSLLGILTAHQYPESYYAYVGIGQVVDMERNEAVSYQFVLDEAQNRRKPLAIANLKRIGPPPYSGMGELIVQRRYLGKFGGAVYKKPEGGGQIRKALHSPEYAPLDYLRYAAGTYYSNRRMWDEVMTYDLIRQVPSLDLPVYFFEGRHDYNTPWELVSEYYDKLDAPQGKTLIWFEDSAHSPNLEEPDRFARMMVDRVLTETYAER